MADKEEMLWVLWKKLGSEKDLPSDYERYVGPILSVVEVELEEKQEEIDDLRGQVSDQEIEIEELRRKLDEIRDVLQ